MTVYLDTVRKHHSRPRTAILTASFVYVLLQAFSLSAQTSKIAKLGWLGARSLPGPDGKGGSGAELFRTELTKLGYIEGKNVSFEFRYADAHFERLPALAEELVGLKVDVLIAPTTVEALAASKTTSKIPIVFFNVPDPVASGLVQSLARPGGNITGFSTVNTVLAGKRLEWLKETIPQLSLVGVLWDHKNPGSVEQWEQHQRPALELGLLLHSMNASSADQYEAVFKSAVSARSSAVSVAQSTLLASNPNRFFDLLTKHRLPAIYSRTTYVTGGGLMAYGSDLTESFSRAAIMVDKILKGAKPSDIPVEQPTKFELAINLKTAKQIGLTIPPHVLARADRVIR